MSPFAFSRKVKGMVFGGEKNDAVRKRNLCAGMQILTGRPRDHHTSSCISKKRIFNKSIGIELKKLIAKR